MSALPRITLAPLLAFIPAAGVFAHPDLNTFLHHHISVRIDRENVDLTVELTFNAEQSEIERRRMDANCDTVVEAREQAEYVARLVESVPKELQLYWDESPLELVSLYPAEIDFLDSAGVRAHPHVLRLFYFARTPKSLREAGRVIVLDELWAGEPAVLTTALDADPPFQLAIERLPNPGELAQASRTKTPRRLAIAYKWRPATDPAIRNKQTSKPERDRRAKTRTPSIHGPTGDQR